MFNEQKFKCCVLISGKSVSEIAQALDINETTFYRKMKNNGSFSRAEIQKLIEVLKIDDPMSIFFASQLAKTQEE